MSPALPQLGRRKRGRSPPPCTCPPEATSRPAFGTSQTTRRTLVLPRFPPPGTS